MTVEQAVERGFREVLADEVPGVFYVPIDAFIRESKRDDCLPEYRFRAVLADGSCRWFPTHGLAAAAVFDSATAKGASCR